MRSRKLIPPKKWSLQCRIVDVDAVPTTTSSKDRAARVANRSKGGASAAMKGGESESGDGSARSGDR